MAVSFFLFTHRCGEIFKDDININDKDDRIVKAAVSLSEAIAVGFSEERFDKTRGIEIVHPTQTIRKREFQKILQQRNLAPVKV